MDVSLDSRNLTPNPFPSGKGNRTGERGKLTVAEMGVVDYDDALAMQTAMLAARIEGSVDRYAADDGASARVYAWAWGG